MSKHEKYLKLLTTIASGIDRVSNSRHAAAVVLKNEIVSFGINQKKSHPFQKQFQKHNDCIWLHSEIDAIKNSLKQISVDELGRCTLYVARVKYDNKKKLILGNSRPCSGCMKAIAHFNIRNVYYTLDNSGYNCL